MARKLKNGLTFRQDMFASYYAQYQNGTKAAIKAGYKAKTAYSMASRLLRNVKVLRAVIHYNNKAKGKSIADHHEVMQYITRAMRGKSFEHVVGVDVTGKSYDLKKPPDIHERLNAAEDLLKQENYKTVEKYKLKKAAQEIKKIRAEAEIKKYDAKQDNSAQNKTINQTTKILQKLENAGKK